MAAYKNISVGAHVHNGKVIAPGQTFSADASGNLQKLIAAGVLEEVKSADAGAKAAGGEGEGDKAALLARAKELGIDAKGTWGVAKLQETIAEAEKSAAGGEGA